MKEQNECDQMPSSLLDQLQRILPLADTVADEIVCEETDILKKIMPQMFEVMQRIAKFLCDYVKWGHLSRRSLLSMDSANADDRRENRGCSLFFEGQRQYERNGRGVSQRHQTLPECGECRGSTPSQKDW